MKIAIASGKGGTGKTTVATNLAYYLANRGQTVIYADCDVEEPNGFLFLTTDWKQTSDVTVKYPVVDEAKCDFCGECAEICRFNALAVLSAEVLVFPSLCHSCGGCFYVCPQKAITEEERPVGVIREGTSRGMMVYEGRLNIGEAVSPPVIKKLKEILAPTDFTIIDSPPGTSCPVIEAIKDTDFVLLVTEPTPFGLNDLKLAVAMVRALDIPFGVVVNRHGLGDNRVHEFCGNHGIDIISEIPNDLKIAEACSQGKLILESMPEYKVYFESLLNEILKYNKAIGA